MKLLAAAVLLVTVAQAQARDCSGISDPSKRLQCYDENIQPTPAPTAKAASARQPEFTSYAAETYRGPARQPDFKGRDRSSANYRTRILQGMQGAPNFAGRARVVDIGCGTGCVFHPIVDLSTGRVSMFPLSGDDHPYLEIDYRPNSRLMVATWQAEKGCGSEAFVWTGAGFDSLGARNPGVGAQCGLRSEQRPYEGAWAVNAKDCKEASDGNFRIQGTTYKGWESECRIDRATMQGQEWALSMSCGGEGETWKETTTYLAEADGRLSVVDNGRKVRSYLRCDGAAAALPTEVGMETPPPGTLTEWTYDAEKKLVWSCDDFDVGKGKACLSFACDYKSPTMTFFTREAAGDTIALLGPGKGVAMPPTRSQEEKSFAKLFGMNARTLVLDGNEQLGSYFDGMRRQPISVSTEADRWSFAIARGKSLQPLGDFKAECLN